MTRLYNCRCGGIGRRPGLKMSHASHRSKPGKPCATRVFQNEKSPIFGIGLHFGLQIPKSILEHLSPQAPMPVWWNWQTPGTQNPVSARTCGFDPRHRHQTNKIRTRSSLWETGSDFAFSTGISFSPMVHSAVLNPSPEDRERRNQNDTDIFQTQAGFSNVI